MSSVNNNNNNNDNYENVYVTLRLHKNIARLLIIFANIHAEKGSTEEKRIDNFLVQEITETVKALAAEPLPEEYPDSLKQLIRMLFNSSKTTN
jgi:hypothetical protein